VELETQKTGILRRRFGLVLAAALLPILLLSIGQSYHDYQRDTQIRETALDVSAQNAISDIIDLLKTAKSILSLSADLVRPETCEADLTRITRDFTDIYNMAVYWGEGQDVCSVGKIKTRLATNPDLSMITPQTPFLFNVVEFEENSIGPKRMLVIEYGKYDQDKNLQGIFFTGYDLSTLQSLRSREILPRDVRVSIFSRNGQVLVGDKLGTGSERESWARLLDNEDRLSLSDAQNKSRKIVLLPTRSTEVFLAISAPTPSLISWNRINPWASILLPVLGWVFAYIAIWAALELLVLSRIRDIRKDIFEFSKSNQVPSAEIRNGTSDVISDLRASFRKMAETIVKRETDLNKSLSEKDDILREVHHRVKNNLQIIISLLNMGKRQVKDPFYTQALDDTRNRISAIAQVHKTQHESETILSVDLAPFMTELTNRLSRALDFEGRLINIVTHVDAEAVSADTATPISLFMVEALTNAAKHGLPDGGTISTTLIEANGLITLTVQDNGVGAQAASALEATSPELSTSTGTGLRLMEGFARQLGGTYESESSSKGYMCRLSFPRHR